MLEDTRTRYENRMNVEHGPLELIDEKRISESCRYPWFNQTLCEVNDTWIRLGVCEGEYHWHQHDDTDEFFHVLEGRWFIDLDGRTVELAPRQGFVVPKGVRHRPRAPTRTVLLMAEKRGVVPTGTHA
jgi:mannose-6-phosphate isomerase-like protein (cupin superfamily)